MGQPFATVEDLADRWRPLQPDEQAKATTLLGDASYWLRRWFPGRTAEIDGGADSTGAKIVACNMVKRALMNAANEGVKNDFEGQGPFTRSKSYSNPDGNLYVTEAERAEFAGVAHAGSFRMVGL